MPCSTPCFRPLTPGEPTFISIPDSPPRTPPHNPPETHPQALSTHPYHPSLPPPAPPPLAFHRHHTPATNLTLITHNIQGLRVHHDDLSNILEYTTPGSHPSPPSIIFLSETHLSHSHNRPQEIDATLTEYRTFYSYCPKASTSHHLPTRAKGGTALAIHKTLSNHPELTHHTTSIPSALQG